MISVVESDVVYRNPHPHLRAVHAWHPSLVHLGDGRWLASFDLADAVESHTYGTYLSRSDDDARTWSTPQRVLDREQHDGSYTLRLSRTADGTLTLAGALHDPRPVDQGLLNAETFGYTPMTLNLMTSTDDGATWDGPRPMDHPLTGAEFETCHAIVELADGRWLLPTSTWMSWDGSAPHGMKAVALSSSDRGGTWPDVITVADSWSQRRTHFEQSLGELSDGRLIAVTWELDVDSGETAPTPYWVATDGSRFDAGGHTGFLAQTAKLCVLPDDSVLVVWRGHAEPGLWASRARLDGTRWVTEETVQLWSGAQSGMAGAAAPGVELSDLKFGYPSPVARADGDVELVFWCREDDVNVVRRMRLTGLA